jgi:Icc-related predicted phosphoesterase
MTDEPRVVKIPGQRITKLAIALLGHHPFHGLATSEQSKATFDHPLKIVCISDSHNKQPELPPGDVLIHAGDLTENGSFDEVQTQLNWLSSQPHKHKILIAGNHDVLLDEVFLDKFPWRRYGQTQTATDIDWGSVTYLNDTSIILTFEPENAKDSKPRQLKIFGSPWTPKYGNSAFQYPREEDIWSDLIPHDIDILVTHGPPRLYLDSTGLHKAGCVFLAKQISRIRPRLVVFGHIHVAHGRQDVVLDTSRELHDEITNQWGGYWTLARLAAAVIFAKLRVLVMGMDKVRDAERMTTFVNASVVGGPQNELMNEPTVVYI